MCVKGCRVIAQGVGHGKWGWEVDVRGWIRISGGIESGLVGLRVGLWD
jgi:hypothetical protein